MSTPTADPTTPLSRAPLELAIAMDEWRRSRANDELIWSSGTLRVRLTVGRRLVATVGLLTLYDVQVTTRNTYLEARSAAIAVAQALRPKVAARERMLANYRYPGPRSAVIRQARLFLLDDTTPIHALYDRFDPLERAMEPGEERAILANISQALANTIF